MTALPQLKLEPNPDDPDHLRLIFQPDSSTWSFDETRGTKDQLRDQIMQQVTLFLTSAQPDDRFTETAQQTLRTNIRHLLLQWIGFRGLRIPAGS